MFESIAAYLEGESLGQLGKSIFIGSMPANVKLGILLLHPYGGIELDPELPGYRNTRFQVAVRAENFQEGAALAKQVSEALTIFEETAMDTVVMKFIHPMNDPYPFQSSDGGMHEFVVNFHAIYVIVP